MEKKQNLRTWLIPKLRRLSYQWPPRRQTLLDARVSRGKYECAECKRQGKTDLWGPKEISLDHIETIIPLTGWDDWDGVIKRLFCEKDLFQVLCTQHHDEKTEKENLERKEHKKKLDNGNDF